MKLQIVEYSVPSVIDRNMNYCYILELDEKGIVWCSSTQKLETEKVIGILNRKLLDEHIDLNMEHLVKFNMVGTVPKILFVEDVSDSFLKEIFVERRKKAIEEDFK